MKSPIKIISKKSMSCGRATIVEIGTMCKYTGEVYIAQGVAICDPEDIFNIHIGLDLAEERAIKKAYSFFYRSLDEIRAEWERNYKEIEAEILKFVSAKTNCEKRIENMLDIDE